MNPRRKKGQKLIQEYQKNQSEEKLNKIVEHYEALIRSMANKYARGRRFYEDIVQVGMLGLVKAVKRYDSSYGKVFDAYAIPTIVGEMKRFLRDKTWGVKVPRRVKELGPQIKKAVDELSRELQREPSLEEISEYLHITPEELLEANEAVRHYQTISFERSPGSMNDDESANLHHYVGKKDQQFALVENRMLLASIRSSLSEREQKILQYIFFENKSQQAVGKKLGISQMHVSRLQRNAIKKLRQEAVLT
ncbi:RNA polymerase sigma factor SigB [Bacillus sp. HMF5848]|uniref:SigB/SigF/SigG family RNA polymerase sigma factor n=1 Tax=Bacillus sp. HMF5848 TaxID=2495421 RepID=UPI000F76F747|nr:SigB/SigF/SigG family RNA polymerase sigma factor [Bacillus sp. HMF5848]RSK25667.1 RNA polymerase sigma factor SigB [Bacillus sp. HMF5848]